MASSFSATTADVDVDVDDRDCLCISCLRVSSMSEQYRSRSRSRSRYIKVDGTIVRRRSMGKYLAFAEIQSTSCCTCDNSNNSLVMSHSSIETAQDNPHIVKVAFRRKSPSWNMAKDDTFPIKNSLLPYGAKVELYVVQVVNDNVNVDDNAAAVKTLDASSASNNNNMNTSDGQDVDPSESTPPSRHPPPSPLSSYVFEVHSWVVLVNPSETALDQATLTTTDNRGIRIRDEGVSCSKYLRARQESYMQAQTTRPLVPASSSLPLDQDNNKNKNTNNTSPKVEECDQQQHQQQVQQPSELPPPPHGDKKAKALRARVFASWLIENFSREVLLVDQNGIGAQQVDHASSSGPGYESGSGSGVLDIAGGKGQLSIELSIQAGGIFCTVIDPLVRKRGMSSNSSISNGRTRVVGLSSRDKKRLDKIGATQPLHVARPFGDGLLKIPEYDTLVKQASCLVGLHPDECTEAILDKALLYGKPVAIVPCCVFPHMFPDRYLVDRPDVPVTTYEEFLQYLLEKDDRLQRATLPFEGRNQVIYYV